MNNPTSISERVLRGSSTILLLTLLTSPLGYLIRMLYSQTLSVEMYGFFYAALAFFNILAVYNDLGFGYSVSYLIPKYLKENQSSVILHIYRYSQVISLATAILISLVVASFTPWLVKNYFKVSGVENVIYIFCLYLITSSFLGALIQVFIGLQKEKYYSSINLIRLSLVLSFSLLFWIFDKPNVLTYAISWTIGYLSTSIIYIWLLTKKHTYLASLHITWNKKLFKQMSMLALPILMTTSVYSMLQFSDTFFLTLFRGVKDVGIYNVALPLVSLSTVFLGPLNNLFLPLISRLMEGEQDKVKYILEKALMIIPFIGWYFALFIIMFPSAPIRVLFGNKWIGLVETPLMILAVGFIISSLFNFLTIVISGMGRVKERFKATVLIAIFSIVVNGLLIFSYGVIGAALGYTIVSIFTAYLFGRIINEEIRFTYPIKFYLKLLVLSAILLFISKISGIYPTNLPLYLIFGVFYTLIITIFAYYLNLIDIRIIKLITKQPYAEKTDESYLQ